MGKVQWNLFHGREYCLQILSEDSKNYKGYFQLAHLILKDAESLENYMLII